MKGGTGLTWLSTRLVGCSKTNHEPSSCLKAGIFLTGWLTISFSCKTVCYEVIWLVIIYYKLPVILQVSSFLL